LHCIALHSAALTHVKHPQQAVGASTYDLDQAAEQHPERFVEGRRCSELGPTRRPSLPVGTLIPSYVLKQRGGISGRQDVARGCPQRPDLEV